MARAGLIGWLAMASAPKVGLAAPLTAALGTVPGPDAVARPSVWPASAATERRWWIPLPSEPSISPDADLSNDPRQWRLELIVGRFVEVDCNRHQFSGGIRTETLQPSGLTIHRVELGPMLSTRMACPSQPLRRRFIALAGRPYVVPYDASRPVVVYAPADAELRWRLWRPERQLHRARAF